MELLTYKDSWYEYTYYIDINERIVKHGEFKRWFQNGQPWEHCFYVNGRYHGEYKSWYYSGQLRTRCFYVDGKLHGEYNIWYEVGRRMEHQFFIYDKKFPASKFKSEEEKLLFRIQHPDFRFIEDF